MPLIGRLPLGLSPRVRGNLLLGLIDFAGERSIPACAGEPSPAAPAGVAGGVYPRVCGGTPGMTEHDAEQSGLSPRVRGNRALT